MLELEQQELTDNRTTRSTNRKRKIMLINLSLFWTLLFAAAGYGTYHYITQLQSDLSSKIESQTNERLAQMQLEYDQKIVGLEEKYTAQIAELHSQITEMNELLSYTKDSATDDTDNSNKLYTQISEMKKQLVALQKSLELLK